MTQINKEAMDDVLGKSLPREIYLPIDITREWQMMITQINSTDERLSWLDNNVMRLTYDEYAGMIEALLIYLAIENGLKELSSKELDIHVINRYTKSMNKELSNE